MNNLQRAIDSDYGTLALGPEPNGTGWQAPNPRKKPKGNGGICIHTVKGRTVYRATININKRRFSTDRPTRALAEQWIEDIKAKYSKRVND